MSFSDEQIKILTKASNNFVVFVNEIFSKSEKIFIGGQYVDDTARFLSKNKKTIRISARNHFKSFSLYAYFMWKLLFEGASQNIEAHYLSYNQDLAGYHIKKIKAAIENNPFFKDIIDAKPTAETVLQYTWDKKHYTTLTPHGLIQFKRGIHAELVFVDDPFQDPENELNHTVIRKINEIFKSNILDMPKEPDGELHVVGTAQSDQDFFFDKTITKRFAVRISPAITEKGEALWPEWMNLEELAAKREERTERIFQREYLCKPVYSTKAFFSKDKLQSLAVNSDLINLRYTTKYETTGYVIGAFDIGKKAHPAHLSIFDLKDNKLIMIHQKFMDDWPYSNGSIFNERNPSQLEYLKTVIENFGINELYYDNTKGEFEAYAEQGLLPRQMIPVVFTNKFKNISATAFDRMVERKQIELIDDDRFLSQICSVSGELIAPVTAQGHGDSFWTCAMAVNGIKDRLMYSADETGGPVRRKIMTGQKSLFDDNSPIPGGF